MHSTQNRPAVVFGLLHAGLAIARSLGRGGIPVDGIALEPYEFGLRSRYLRRRVLLRSDRQEQRDRQLLAALREAGGGRRVVLFAESDRNMDVILRNWDAVCQLAIMPLPGDADSVLRLSRKDMLLEEAARAGIPVPATTRARTEGEVRASRLRPPILIKPVEGEEFARAFGEKAFLAENEAQVLAAWRRAEGRGFATILQEVVPDADARIFSLFTYIGRSGQALASVVGRKVRQAPLRFGTSSVFEVTSRPEVVELGLGLLTQAEFRGFAHVEFAHDARDGLFKLLEVNTRIPVWAGIAMNRHLDMARIAYDDLCGREAPPPQTLTRELTWINLVKDVWVSSQMALRHELGPREFLAYYRRRDKARALFSGDDLGPVLASVPYHSLQARRYRGSGAKRSRQRVPSAFSQTSGAPERR